MSSKTYGRILILVTIFTMFLSYNNTLLNEKLIKASEREVIKIPENILFLGDSITAFYNLDDYYDDTTYMVNSGYSGYYAEDLRKELQEKAFCYNPSKVFILVGINDIQKLRGQDNEAIFESIKDIVEQFKQVRPFTDIYVESIYPVNATDDPKIDISMVGIRRNNMVQEINQMLEDYCRENDITYVDVYSELVDENNNLNINYTKEGLHLNDEGYKVVTKVLKQYI